MLMDDLEVKAEVFRIIRNFQDLGRVGILKKFDELLPDVSKEQIANAIEELKDKAV